jgi:hypothetical protein
MMEKAIGQAVSGHGGYLSWASLAISSGLFAGDERLDGSTESASPKSH